MTLPLPIEPDDEPVVVKNRHCDDSFHLVRDGGGSARTVSLSHGVDALERERSNAISIAAEEYVRWTRVQEALLLAQVRASSNDLVVGFMGILDEMRRTLARSPKWVDIEDAVALYGVPGKTIKEWTRQGFVRKAKLGPTFQSKTIYNAEDLHDVLCQFAAGKPPVNALGKVI